MRKVRGGRALALSEVVFFILNAADLTHAFTMHLDLSFPKVAPPPLRRDTAKKRLRMKEVRRLRRQGLTYAAIGARLGISKGRAAQYYWAKYQQPEVDAKTGKRPWWKGER